MKRYGNSQGDVLVLRRGEELVTTLMEYAEQNNLAGAWLQSGLGGSGSVILSFYNLKTRKYTDKTFDDPLEIISLQGNLAWVDEKPFWHVHGVFGTPEYQTLGGHVKSLTIALTGELFIVPLEKRLTRTCDKETGLGLLASEDVNN